LRLRECGPVGGQDEPKPVQVIYTKHGSPMPVFSGNESKILTVRHGATSDREVEKSEPTEGSSRIPFKNNYYMSNAAL